MTSERLLNMSIKFYTSPKNFIPPPKKSKFLATSLALTIFETHGPTKQRTDQQTNKHDESQYILADVIIYCSFVQCPHYGTSETGADG